eukprot:2573596-Pleurochrysis_carterae.AAC.1
MRWCYHIALALEYGNHWHYYDILEQMRCIKFMRESEIAPIDRRVRDELRVPPRSLQMLRGEDMGELHRFSQPASSFFRRGASLLGVVVRGAYATRACRVHMPGVRVQRA